ncbi:MAG: type II secretion system F family protein [Rhodopseudomonas palustris]|nr:type II secretion system F family protein [Rhodopseudomonas palustris]
MGGTAARELQSTLANARVSFIVAGVLLAGAVTAALDHFCSFQKNAKTKRALDKALLALPFAGKYLVELNTLDFVFSMEALVSSGITVNDALSESLKSIGNSEYAGMVLGTKEAINKGLLLSTAFMATGDRRFPSQLAMWIKVGERSGNVASVFGHMRAYYEEAVNKKEYPALLGLSEPGMNVLIGIIMLFVIFYRHHSVLQRVRFDVTII